jgi:hypothetical protein
MQTVIYSRDFEPITIVDLKMEILKTLEKDGRCGLVIDTGEKCRLFVHPIVWNNMENISERNIIVALDEEIALKLQPTWLPGQRSTVNFALRGIRRLKAELQKYIGRD